MGDLVIRLRDARREPLDDIADISVLAVRGSATVALKKNARGSLRVEGLSAVEPYVVRAFPVRHRPVAQIARPPASGRQVVELYCPVYPERVASVVFPSFDALDERARAIIAASSLEFPVGLTGAALYHALSDVQKAGLLNILAKMDHTVLPGGTSVLDHVASLYRIRGDRVFADVANGLRDLVVSSVDVQAFHRVSGSRHTPPPGFQPADSFKTLDRYGNLQMTFFSTVGAPLRFQADIDIDDAAGIAHVFQVLGHDITGAETHPYDIHEILLFHQRLDPGYRLLT